MLERISIQRMVHITCQFFGVAVSDDDDVCALADAHDKDKVLIASQAHEPVLYSILHHTAVGTAHNPIGELGSTPLMVQSYSFAILQLFELRSNLLAYKSNASHEEACLF